MLITCNAGRRVRKQVDVALFSNIVRHLDASNKVTGRGYGVFVMCVTCVSRVYQVVEEQAMWEKRELEKRLERERERERRHSKHRSEAMLASVSLSQRL